MKYTENYGLLKPEGTEFYDVSDQNNNMDIIDSELKTATNIAKGRNQALVYSTYAEMVAELNTLPNSELKVGQNIYIGAVGVPDVWIYGVLEESTEYEYISDEAIIEAVGNNVSLQIGYYQIAFLETQKVDLTTIEDEISEVKEDVAELADSLVAQDLTPFRFGVNENGEYGYIVTDSAGADTVIPFKKDSGSTFTQTTTKTIPSDVKKCIVVICARSAYNGYFPNTQSVSTTKGKVSYVIRNYTDLKDNIESSDWRSSVTVAKVQDCAGAKITINVGSYTNVEGNYYIIY